MFQHGVLARTAGLFATGVLITIGATGVQAARDASPTGNSVARARSAYGALPLSFEGNEGQADPRVRFVARGGGYLVSLTSTEAFLALSKADPETDGKAAGLPRISTDVVRMTLVGANLRPRVEGRDALAGRSNYFGGSDPATWHTNIRTYAKVNYEAVYPGVDLVYYGNQRQLEYDFVVGPGADPHAIALAFAGARGLRIDADGSLVLTLPRGELRQHAPVVYQDVRGVRTVIPGRYVITGETLVAFEIGTYDRRRPLVIDPTLAYSTYLGASGYESGSGIAVDASGNAYVTGFSSSAAFPTTPGAFNSSVDPSCCSAFVAKFNPAGSALVYSTFIAGPAGGNGIAIDAAGNAYVAGGAGPGLPIVNGYQPFNAGNSDGFVAKLNPTGSALLYSSYIGGGGNDTALAVAVDATGHAYAVGYHNSGNGLTTTSNALLTYNPSYGCDGGGATGFLVRVNTNAADAASLEYATNIAGAGGGTNAATGVAVDGAGNAYVSGASSSSFFPTTPGAFQPAFNGSAQCWVDVNAYVVKINTAPASCSAADVNGTYVTCPESLVYGSYLGGSVNSFANGIAIDAAGNATVTGGTAAADFPVTAGAAQGANAGGTDAFVTRLNASGSALLYSTYLGGSADDVGARVAVDAAGHAFVTGYTGSTNFPTTPDALQTVYAGANDAFLVKLNATGTAPLAFASYLGGAGDDRGADVAVDGGGNAFVTGTTWSGNFPTTPGAFQPASGGTDDPDVPKNDGFVTKISLAPPPTPQEEIQSVVADIASLPGLSGAQVTSATAKLTAALNSLASGNTTAATNQLHALTNQIRALINSRRVTASDGQSVIDAVNGIITQITP